MAPSPKKENKNSSPSSGKEKKNSSPSSGKAEPPTHKRARGESTEHTKARDSTPKRRKTQHSPEGSDQPQSCTNKNGQHKRRLSSGSESSAAGPSSKRCRQSSVPPESLTVARIVLQSLDVRLLDKEELDAMSCESLGQGAFGACRKAVHPLTGDELVIKTLYQESAYTDLLMEASNLRLLQAPGVVRMFGVCVETCEIVMYYAGVTADEYFSVPRPFREKVSVVLQVARALQAILQRSHTHNDLKGNNVCVSLSSGAPIATVIDLGLTRKVGTQSPFTQKNTLRYPWVAPEVQRHTHPTSEASDVFSLAVMVRDVVKIREDCPNTSSMAAFALWEQNALQYNFEERPTLADGVLLLEALLEEATRSHSSPSSSASGSAGSPSVSSASGSGPSSASSTSADDSPSGQNSATTASLFLKW